MPKFYGYCRASSNEQEITLTVQQEQIRREYDYMYAKDFEWGGCFIDRGVSGSKAIRCRAEGRKLDVALEEGDAVCFSKLDRGFRNTIDAIETVNWWQGRKCRVLLLDLRIDTGTAIGMMLLTVFAGIAEFERNRMRDRMLECQAKRKRLGLPTNRPPYGFKCIGPKGQRRFAPCAEERAWGAKILAWHKAGWDNDTIYLHLFKIRAVNKHGREWSLGGIMRAIRGEAALQAKEAAEKPVDKTNGTCHNPPS